MGNKSSKISENSRIIEFLEFETALHKEGDHAATAIGSVYSVETPVKENSDNIKTCLQERIRKILIANDWLMGRVRTLSKPSRVGLVLEDKFSNPEDYRVVFLKCRFLGRNSRLWVNK